MKARAQAKSIDTASPEGVPTNDRRIEYLPLTSIAAAKRNPKLHALGDLGVSIATKPGAAIYMAMSAQEWPTIDRALRETGFHWSSTIIWSKDTLVLSRKDYHTQYEPIWYGWSGDGARLHPLRDRKQSDLRNIPRPKRSDEHPTMKPVELIARALRNSSSRKALVFEPFSGSGSTLIACEVTGRVCRAIELDPAYVQVAIERWERFTGRRHAKA